MIYVIEGHVNVDEKPVHYEMNDGVKITVTEHEQPEYLMVFDDFEFFIEWGMDNIKWFGLLK